MTLAMNYKDVATFVKVTAGEYRNSKVVQEQEDVPVIFIQNSKAVTSNNQDDISSDAVCYVDPYNAFVLAEHYRLEGMYVLAPLFGVGDAEGWYRVTSVSVARDHLLGNVVDNVELLLKKSSPISGVS